MVITSITRTFSQYLGKPHCFAKEEVLFERASEVHKEKFFSDFTLIHNFITHGLITPDPLPALDISYCAEEEEALIQFSDEALKKRRYELMHWDGVIQNYREQEIPFNVQVLFRAMLLSLIYQNESVQQTITRVRKTINEFCHREVPFLQHFHILDLLEQGEIRYHVDNVEVLFFPLESISQFVVLREHTVWNFLKLGCDNET